MNRNLRLFVVSLVALLVSTNALWATPRISLVTITPGPIVFEAFGHSAVLVENPDLASGQMVGPQAYVYEYGNVETSTIFLRMGANPMAGMNALLTLFNEQTPTRVTKLPTSVDPTTHIPSILFRRYLRPELDPREIIVNPLSLTDDQARAVVAGLERDLAAGQYFYRRFDANCATGPRNQIFGASVLGDESRARLDETVNIARREVVMESVDYAIRNSADQRVYALPPAFAVTDQGQQAQMFLEMLGLRYEYRSSQEFLTALQTTDTLLEQQGRDAAMMLPLATAYHRYFFGPETTETPISRWNAAFTPKRVRELALELTNPATNTRLATSTEEYRANNRRLVAPPVSPSTGLDGGVPLADAGVSSTDASVRE